jgi:hypothetical protein
MVNPLGGERNKITARYSGKQAACSRRAGDFQHQGVLGSFAKLLSLNDFQASASGHFHHAAQVRPARHVVGLHRGSDKMH